MEFNQQYPPCLSAPASAHLRNLLCIHRSLTIIPHEFGSQKHSKPNLSPRSAKRAFWVYLISTVGKEALLDALTGKVVVAYLPTNSAKTLCFQWAYLNQTKLPKWLHRSLPHERKVSALEPYRLANTSTFLVLLS